MTEPEVTACSRNGLDEGRLPVSRGVGVALVLSGIAGSAAAAILLVEKFAVLTNPFHVPSCTVSAALNCGSVMTSPQAEVFGFPNPIIGLATFPIVATIGAAVLAGGRMRQWLWIALGAGSLTGWAFVHWLVIQSVFVIGALCPYCMVVWASVPVATMAAVTVLARALPGLAALARAAPSVVIGWVGGVIVLVAGFLANVWGA